MFQVKSSVHVLFRDGDLIFSFFYQKERATYGEN